jgi:hypothetical protein
MVIKKTFLPLRYIFDKMFLAHEIIDWARCTKQKSIAQLPWNSTQKCKA